MKIPPLIPFSTLLALVSGLLIPSLQAQTYTFNANSGAWETPELWSSSIVPNAEGVIARYNANADGGGSVALNSDVTLGGFTLDGRRDFTINGSSNAITFDVAAGSAVIQGANHANSPVLTINPNLVLADPLSIQLSGSNESQILVNGSITGTGNLTLTNNQTGANSLIRVASVNHVGSVLVNGSNATTFNGSVGSNVTTFNKTGAGVLTVNGSLILGSGSAIAGTGATTIGSGGTLTLDYSAAATAGRLAPNLTLTGSSNLALLGNASANVSETAAGLTVFSGRSVVSVAPGAGQSAGITFSSLNLGTSGLLTFRGANLGVNAPGTADSSTVLFTAAPTLTGGGGLAGSTNISILSRAAYDSTGTGLGNTLITYDAVNGVRGLNLSTEYATFAGSSDVTDNVRITSDLATSTKTVNALVIDATGAARTVTNTGNTVTVTSGNLLFSGDSANNVTGGTLAFGGAAIVLNNASTGNLNISSQLTGSGILTKSDAGTTTLSGATLYSGATTVNNGTLILSASNNATTALTVNSGGTLQLGGATYSAATLTLNSGSTLVLAANVTPGTGPAAINGGTIQSDGVTGRTLGGNKNIQGNFATGGDGNITLSSNFVLTGNRTITVNNDLTTISGITTETGGARSLTKAGAGTLVIGQTMSNTGGVVVNAGTARINANNRINDSNALTVNTNGTFDTAGFFDTVALVSGAGTITSSSGTGTLRTNSSSNATFSGQLTGSLSVEKEGTGTWTLSGANNNYTGSTTIRGGTIQSGSTNALATTTTLNMGTTSASTFNLNGNNQTVAGLANAGSSARTITSAAAATFTLNNATSNTFTGNLTGAGLSFVKTGNGSLDITGTSTYGGTTNVSAGALLLNGTHTGGGDYTVGASGTLGGTGSADASVSVEGTLSPGDTTSGTGRLTMGGSTTFETGGKLQLQMNSATVVSGYDQYTTGGLTLNSTELELSLSFDPLMDTIFTLADNTSGSAILGLFRIGLTPLNEGSIFSLTNANTTNSFDFQASYLGGTGNDFTLTVVPEPSASALLGLGLVALLGARRRRSS